MSSFSAMMKAKNSTSAKEAVQNVEKNREEFSTEEKTVEKNEVVAEEKPLNLPTEEQSEMDFSKFTHTSEVNSQIFHTETKKRTSLRLSDKAVKYLKIASRINVMTHEQYVVMLIDKDIAAGEPVINIEDAFSKKEIDNPVTFSVALPFDVCNTIKERSSKQFKSISKYVDDLILAEMKKE